MANAGDFEWAVNADGDNWFVRVTATVAGVDHPECVPGWRVQLVDSGGRVVEEHIRADHVRATLVAKGLTSRLRQPGSAVASRRRQLAAEMVEFIEGIRPPEPPAVLDAGTGALVAACRSGDAAALLWVWHEEESDSDPYSTLCVAYRKDPSGWNWAGGCGSTWPLEYGVRPDKLQTLSGIRMNRPRQQFRAGIAPAGTETVTLSGSDEHREVEVDRLTGAFLLAEPFDPPHFPQPPADPA